MGQVGDFFRRAQGNDGRVILHYWCQGCHQIHGVVVEGPGAWGFNGSYERPTFTPSVLVRGHKINPEGRGMDHWVRDAEGKPVPSICHTFITDGMVQFLGDCTHQFAGQTAPLPPLPAAWRDDDKPQAEAEADG